MAKVVAMTIDPPIPWRKRMTIIDSIDQAWESRPPATVKATMPYWKTFRRPWMSPMRPIDSRKIEAERT